MNDIKSWINERQTLRNEIVADELYEYLKDRCDGLSAVSEHVVLSLVGSYGLVVLKDAGMLEVDGIIDNIPMYALSRKRVD